MNKDLDSDASNIVKLTAAVSSLVHDQELAKSIAFNIGDMRNEIDEVSNLLSKVISQQEISLSELKRLHYLFCIHWKFHINELESGFTRLFGKD